jgi:hypothetical protein
LSSSPTVILIRPCRSDDVDSHISHLSADISSALFELENHYYQSKWRVSPDAAAAADTPALP